MLTSLEFLAKNGSQVFVRRQQYSNGGQPTVSLAVGNFQKNSVPLETIRFDANLRVGFTSIIYEYVEGRKPETNGELSPYRILVDMLVDG